MSIQIEPLRVDHEAAYENLVRSRPEHLLYASLKYRDFLRRILTASEDRYLLAMESGRLVGALPSFVMCSAAHGTVVNSLPFYGSHGDVLLGADVNDGESVIGALLEAFDGLCEETSAAASTLISNPLTGHRKILESRCRCTHTDERIGQITPLPGDSVEVEGSLMSMFHYKTRNMIRKARKLGVNVVHDDCPEALRQLHRLHEDNMTAIGGMPKPWSAFEAIRDIFDYDRDYRVYLATQEKRVIGALLVFYYNQTAEYFTPAALAEFRTLQPTSLLILEAMVEAARRGYGRWNWGGTWTTQAGVYNFKKRWGTKICRTTTMSVSETTHC